MLQKSFPYKHRKLKQDPENLREQVLRKSFENQLSLLADSQTSHNIKDDVDTPLERCKYCVRLNAFFSKTPENNITAPKKDGVDFDKIKQLFKILRAPVQLIQYLDHEIQLDEELVIPIKFWYQNSILTKLCDEREYHLSKMELLADVFDFLSPENNPGLEDAMKQLFSPPYPDVNCIIFFEATLNSVKHANIKHMHFYEHNELHDNACDLFSSMHTQLIISTRDFFLACYEGKKTIQALRCLLKAEQKTVPIKS